MHQLFSRQWAVDPDDYGCRSAVQFTPLAATQAGSQCLRVSDSSCSPTESWSPFYSAGLGLRCNYPDDWDGSREWRAKSNGSRGNQQVVLGTFHARAARVWLSHAVPLRHRERSP